MTRMVISFDDLIALLVRGVESPSFVGTYTRHDQHAPTTHWRVWRHGDLARIENPPGETVLIAGATTYWRRARGGEVESIERSPGFADFELSEFIWLEVEAYWRDWLEQDRDLVERTLRPVTVAGRPAWEFTAPEVKGAAPVVVVDADLGLVLAASRDDIGTFMSWSEISTDIPLADDLFEYSGEWPPRNNQEES